MVDRPPWTYRIQHQWSAPVPSKHTEQLVRFTTTRPKGLLRRALLSAANFAVSQKNEMHTNEFYDHFPAISQKGEMKSNEF
jgi:hypothetical protein